MKLSEFATHLETYPDHELVFILPDGGRIPVHAHITEVGRIDRTFIDCGGTIRSHSMANLQAWVADDLEHRLRPAKLADVLARSTPLFRGDDLDVQLEYEDGVVSQFPILEAGATEQHVYFRLAIKHTDCLAKDVCLAPATEASCCSGSGCC